MKELKKQMKILMKSMEDMKTPIITITEN